MVEKEIKSFDVQKIIQSQLDQFYSVIAQERESRIKVRNWSITIWLAYTAIIASDKVFVTPLASLIILIGIISIFWTIEGLHQSLVIVNEERARKLEELLSKTILPTSVSPDLFYEFGYKTISRKVKIKAFLDASFKSEPILFFHLALIFGSILFVIFFHPHSAASIIHP